MRPTQPCGGAPQSASSSKARRGCPATLSRPKCAWTRPCAQHPRNEKKPPGTGPAASGSRQSSGRKLVRRGRFRDLALAGVVGATLPVMARAALPAAHADQHGEAVLLAFVEALVERLRGVGELLQAGGACGHGVGALAQPRDRVRSRLLRIVATAARFAAGGPLLHAVAAGLGEIADRGFHRRPVLLLLGGELQSGL